MMEAHTHYYGGYLLSSGFIFSNKKRNSKFLLELLQIVESKMFWTFAILVWYMHFTFDYSKS